MELLLWDFDDKNICVSCRRWSGNSHRHDDPTFPFGGVPKSRVATGLVALSEAVQTLGVFFFFFKSFWSIYFPSTEGCCERPVRRAADAANYKKELKGSLRTLSGDKEESELQVQSESF